MTLERIKASDKKYIIGLDEVGYGALSGDLYVSAFMAPKDWSLTGLTDSKAIKSETAREKLYNEIHALSIASKDIAYSVVSVHPNSYVYKEYGTNMHGALKFLYWKAVSRILEATNKGNESLIVLDGSIKFPEYPHSLGESISLPKADALIQQVSAASIIAKVSRDSYMRKLGEKYPVYDWAKNKGYGSPNHLVALKKHGYCDEHRLMYEPIKSMVGARHGSKENS